MKALTGIQLINWHYFINERIRLQGSALLTGDNGSGKSTIFDAIQYALIADQRKVRFNVSAHDETNRDLKGYLRCRTGQDDPQGGDGEGFLRSGDFTSYVALEFQDTARQEQFLLGFAVDTFAGEPDTPQFFRAGGKLDDRLFLTGDRPYSVTEFKAVLKGRRGSEVFSTAAAYRTALKAQLGHLDDRFFTLLVKALAFHPITDIRKFVYDYVLDEREVKIDAMLENFRQYRQYDTLVHQTKEKLARLEGILRTHQERVTLEATAAIQQYVITLAEREAVQADLDRLKSEQQRLRSDYAAADADLARLQAEEQQLEEQLRELQDARARNDAYLAIQALDRELADLNQRADRLQRDGLQLADEARHAVRALQSARRFQSEHPETLRLTEEHLTLLTDGAERLAPLAGGDFSTEPADLSALAPGLEVLSDHVVGRETELRSEQRALEVEKKELDETLSALRKRQRRYDRPVEALLTAIMEKLPDVAPRPLCELIEVPDEAWQNAVEGYLNTQRFDLFVPPEQFDAALVIYEAEKLEQKIAGVGLVNSSALLRSTPTAQHGSLAEAVTTADPAARAYVDRLLGRVMKCADERELKQHNIGITPTCMTYRNHTARQIEFHVYAVPWIGARAIRRQIELKEERLKTVAARLETVRAEMDHCKEFLGLVRGHPFADWQRRWNAVAQLPGLHAQIRQKEAERREIDTESLNALQRQIEEKKRVGEARKADLLATAKLLQKRQDGLAALADRVHEAEAHWQAHHRALEQYAQAHPDVVEAGAARYQEALRRLANREIADNFSRNRQGLLTQAEKLRGDLRLLRSDYNRDYRFGAAADGESNEAYEQECLKLKESELPAYERHIAEARQSAEEEFKEHFIYKLQENIRLARQEFDNLNRALRDVPFGQDRYQFSQSPDRTHKPFYDMIMDDFAMEGFNLFSQHFREKYGQTLDELFRLILDVPEEKQMENIRRYTDYRTYLEFDIKIHHSSGETSSFSKVAREKSGGETQTPFYVAMVASFLQLYRPRVNPHTIRLMMFDEAFNRMDPDRAENMLAFIRKLGLQVLAAAPTDKCEIIAPHVETTLLVMREGNRSWLEEYHQVLAGGLAEAEAAATGEVEHGE